MMGGFPAETDTFGGPYRITPHNAEGGGPLARPFCVRSRPISRLPQMRVMQMHYGGWTPNGSLCG
jgi:hypothetical protein